MNVDRVLDITGIDTQNVQLIDNQEQTKQIFTREEYLSKLATMMSSVD
ncbi:MAG: hypothetical protein IKC79_03180 [Clostridia bacterium]|nr:hypothetical protein [Clostridia bacterium]